MNIGDVIFTVIVSNIVVAVVVWFATHHYMLMEWTKDVERRDVEDQGKHPNSYHDRYA